MLRVGNLQRSIDFYTQVMGMQLLKTSENPAHKYSLAFLGYGSNPEHAELELTYNWGTESYETATSPLGCLTLMPHARKFAMPAVKSRVRLGPLQGAAL